MGDKSMSDPNFIPFSNENIVIEEQEIQMRDGLKLPLLIYRPKKAGRFAALMCTTLHAKEYSKWPEFLERQIQKQNPAFVKPVGELPVSTETPFEGPDPAFWVSNDYVVAVPCILPRLQKERDRWTKAEAQDYYDILEWVAKQDYCNGNVAMSGVSYLAMVQYYTAALHPPHLKAIIPWEGSSDMYRDRGFPGGIPETNVSTWDYTTTTKTVMDEDSLRKSLDSVANQSLIEKNPDLEEIVVPALVCATWSNQGLHSRGSFEAWRRISSEQKWLYTHGRREWEQYYSNEGVEYQKRFLDHFLNAKENGWIEKPRVRLEVRKTRDEYDVREESEFPLSRTIYRRLWLDAENDALNFDGVTHKGKVSYNSDNGGASFDISFSESTELTGYMKLKLWISADEADDADLFATLKKFDSEGNEVFFYGATNWAKGCVALGWMRASQREIDEEKSIPIQPILRHKGERKIEPGRLYPLEIPILPSSTLFRKGEKLRLLISGKDIVKNPQYSYDLTVNRGSYTIYTGGEYDSHLLVPLVPAG